MKTLVLAFALALPGAAAYAQTCTTVGVSTICSDGTTAIRSGDTTFITPPSPSYAAPSYQQRTVVCSQIGDTTICY
jgi:hypothetical protein